MAQDTVVAGGITYTVNSMTGISVPMYVTGILDPVTELKLDMHLDSLTVAQYVSQIERADPPLMITDDEEIRNFISGIEVLHCLKIMKKVLEISGLWPTS